ncbi:MAG: glutamate synthase [Firmicutes bacterium]|nr:glutamate synthase [Bacillota bacterium]
MPEISGRPEAGLDGTTKIAARKLTFRQLNDHIRQAAGDVLIEGCCGQRFIGSGCAGKTITISGTPGNALGAYLDGATIVVRGNAQDAVGDTMNDGKIIIHGNAGDALGYAMRGGSIFVRGNAGYRTGIHMKQYRDKKPVIVVGGTTGSFLGEYLAGGIIIVLGLGTDDVPVGDFIGTGMHGGRIFLRTHLAPACVPEQVTARAASREDLAEILPYLAEFARLFDIDGEQLAGEKYYVLAPNTKNPYKRLYTIN